MPAHVSVLWSPPQWPHFSLFEQTELICPSKNHMVFGRIYLSRNTLGFPRSLMVYASTVQAEQIVPAQVTLCLLLKHISPGLCCLGDTTFLLFRPVAGYYDLLLSILARQVLSISKVASSYLFIY